MRSLLLLALLAVPAVAQPVVADGPPPPPPLVDAPPPPPAPVAAARPPVVSTPISLFDVERPYRLLDLGATGGFNNPGGIIGAEADFRLFTGYFSAGLSGGQGTGDAGLASVLALSEPGGFSIGLSAGFAIF